ncbi:MAG: UDP-N-acetylmuramate--L-alanine ligase, partial [Oscillospiraceae bacterium]|nr:UDP-N-acetylmuramate--L-alanine ligase [Oscillospiraceae bacterium]
AADSSGCGVKALARGLESFTGAGRRFEVHAVINGVTVVDDYAHHPAEIAATLKAAKSMNYKRVWAVHQPFTYSRTKTMLDDFAVSLSIADRVTLTEIMGGREPFNHDIYSEDLSAKIKDCNLFATFEEVADYVSGNSQCGDLIITLGCGDVNKVAKLIVEKLSAAQSDAP